MLVFNEERKTHGRPKVVRGLNAPVLTSHAGLNPRSKLVSLSLTASFAALRAGNEREARVIKGRNFFRSFFLRQKKEVPAQRPGHSRAEVFWKRFLVLFYQSLLRCMLREHSCCFRVLISGIFQENSLQKIQAERT